MTSSVAWWVSADQVELVLAVYSVQNRNSNAQDVFFQLKWQDISDTGDDFIVFFWAGVMEGGINWEFLFIFYGPR